MSLALDLASISDSTRIAELLPYIRDDVEKILRGIENRVQQDIEAGTFTPDKAYTSWIEYGAYRKILKRLDTRVKIGISAGERSGNVLNQGE